MTLLPVIIWRKIKQLLMLDFSKAFNRVETGVLLQQVEVMDKRISNLSPVISGVPQGTVLGPVPFLIHIADLSKDVSIEASTSSFVDDTRARRSINLPAVDCDTLQKDTETIYKWAELVNMVFHSDKFECLGFFLPWRMEVPEQQYIGPDSQPIETKEPLQDLGVELSSDLSEFTSKNLYPLLPS
jgi:ribonuclease P/MRP protein subunit RPP40